MDGLAGLGLYLRLAAVGEWATIVLVGTAIYGSRD